MDLLESTPNEDVLVVLQTESGEKIALPMSALPSDFVPGDSGQLIMVESALDEQQQEVVVESSDMTTTTTAAAATPTEPQPSSNNSAPVPRTYSKNNVVKSYAPTCGTTRIYQQSQISGDSKQITIIESALDEQQQEAVVESSDMTTTTTEQATIEPQPSSNTENFVPHKKQKRKETLLTRPLSEEDMELDFQIIEEPSLVAQEVEVKRKPRKEYRTKKKIRLAKEEAKKEEVERVETKKEREIPRRELPKRGMKQEKLVESPKQQHQQQQQQQQQQPQLERRTRLSNTCRVATGKMYRCNDCDFSTDRINNIVLHVKESCPKLKKT